MAINNQLENSGLSIPKILYNINTENNKKKKNDSYEKYTNHAMVFGKVLNDFK